jgi:hypothetical protein
MKKLKAKIIKIIKLTPLVYAGGVTRKENMKNKNDIEKELLIKIEKEIKNNEVLKDYSNNILDDVEGNGRVNDDVIEDILDAENEKELNENINDFIKSQVEDYEYMAKYNEFEKNSYEKWQLEELEKINNLFSCEFEKSDIDTNELYEKARMKLYQKIDETNFNDYSGSTLLRLTGKSKGAWNAELKGLMPNLENISNNIMCNNYEWHHLMLNENNEIDTENGTLEKVLYK